MNTDKQKKGVKGKIPYYPPQNWCIGDILVFPDTTTVIITSGCFMGTYGISNAWRWTIISNQHKANAKKVGGYCEIEGDKGTGYGRGENVRYLGNIASGEMFEAVKEAIMAKLKENHK